MMENDSSSDDEELNSVKKHIQNQIEGKVNRKRKETPAAALPAELYSTSDQVNVDLPSSSSGIGETEENESSPPSKKYKENMQFPWLELVGPTCHSVKQSKSGQDLSHVKKKYRSMRCLICHQHNPSTPWAELWPRKFELQTLVDHARSGAHIKSDTALKAQPDYVPADPQPSMIKIVTGSGKALQVDKAARDEALEAAAQAAAAVSAEVSDPETAAINTANVRIRGVANGSGSHIVAHSTRIRPEWLYSEGTLCLSDKQMSDPNLTPGTKKKYKQMACLYCREYVQESMWAQLRPRKYESAVIGDHERSAVHQKALELRLARLGGSITLQDNGEDTMLRGGTAETIKFV